jgi:hypothetical protein
MFTIRDTRREPMVVIRNAVTGEIVDVVCDIRHQNSDIPWAVAAQGFEKVIVDDRSPEASEIHAAILQKVRLQKKQYEDAATLKPSLEDRLKILENKLK